MTVEIDVDALVREVVERLEAAAEAGRIEFSKTSFPTALRTIGVTVPRLREVSNDITRRLRKAAARDVVALVQTLVDGGTLEGRKLGYEILGRHKAARGSLDAAGLEALAEGNDNWVCVDNFGGLIAGPVWREGGIRDSVVRGWARSKDRWWRRTAVVATVALNQKARGGTGDAPRTLDICARLAEDHDDMVAKALSWALRELAKIDPDPVREFVEDNADRLPARVTREVRRKLDIGRK